VGTLGDQFLGMFAEIENCMKLALGKRKNVRFMDLARGYVQACNLPASYLISLQTYAVLRNAIDHNSYRGTYPIAEPIPEVTGQGFQVLGDNSLAVACLRGQAADALVCPRGSGSRVPPGVSTHDGLDSEPCRERGCGCDAKKASELAVSGVIRIRSDNPPKRVPEGKSYERCDACNNRCIDQPPWHTREWGTAADYSEIGTSQHQEGKHSAGEQAHREQGRGQEVPLPDSLIEAHSGAERK
jgi:hypothetical protein